ncbi:transporter [Streptomyces sp. PKU-EA00015]|uniref:sodium:solute symporter family transporter n=1 Tax=Streptomyces sp. PKU-EA00015 TaxID=2748326 RepID=UPI0015A0CB6D|nr:transporter [Streptomyces sp. PKU-EA00015]NWF24789.1 transporter [Streptomyces sp. PKU-EA00015]
MTWYLLSSSGHDPIGSAARGPVLIAFFLFIGLALLWVLTLATHDDHPEGLYIADRSLSPVFNGFAMAGEHISVLTLFATTGAIALFGYDGYASAVDSVIALGLLLLLAQKIRNSGRYTLGDLFSLRASGSAPRIAAAVVTLAVTLPMLVLQLRAGGIIAAMLIGMSTDAAQVLCTVLMGGLVVCFAAVADFKGTSRIHVVKVVITLVTLAVLTVLSLRKFSWDAGSLLSAAVDKSVAPDDYLGPGLWAHISSLVPLNMISDHLVQILGTVAMPHLILRIAASRSGRSARRSMSIAAGLTGAYFLLLIATGFAAAAVVGGWGIGMVDANGQGSPILLASDVLPNGSATRAALITVVACVAFLVVLTTVTSVVFAAAVSLAHDVFARADGPRTTTRQVPVLRLAIVALGVMGLTLSAAAHRYSLEFLAIFSMSVAASCVAPAVVYSFFWKGFNRTGLVWSVYGGLLLCTILTMFSPTVSGSAYALMPGADFNWYPFRSPGLVSVPAAFLLGWLGSRNPGRGPVHAGRRVEQGVI